MKALLKKQLAHLPKDQQEMIINMIEKNPKLFDKSQKKLKKKSKMEFLNKPPQWLSSWLTKMRFRS